MLEIVVHSKHGPRIEREERRYHCLAVTKAGNPCKNLTRWFYRPMNSNLCKVHIRKFEEEL